MAYGALRGGSARAVGHRNRAAHRRARKHSRGSFGTDQKASAGLIRRRFLAYAALRGGSAWAVGHAIKPPEGGCCVPESTATGAHRRLRRDPRRSCAPARSKRLAASLQAAHAPTSLVVCSQRRGPATPWRSRNAAARAFPSVRSPARGKKKTSACCVTVGHGRALSHPKTTARLVRHVDQKTPPFGGGFWPTMPYAEAALGL